MTDRPPISMRADARRNRQRLLDVADECFRSGGVATSMDEIARRAGVGPGTLYRHFPTRDDLVLALVADDLDRIADRAEQLTEHLTGTVTGTDHSAAIGAWLGELVAHDLTYRGLAESLVAARGKPTALGHACDRIHAAGAELVRRGQADGAIRPDIAPDDPIRFADAIAWATDGDPDGRGREAMLRTLVDGLRANRGPEGPAPSTNRAN